MTLIVHTARIAYHGPDRLDVTQKTSGPDGRPFAPSGAILWPMKRLEWRASAEVFERAWPGYVDAYTREMRTSYREQRPAWDALLAWPEVTLVCFCARAERCHRSVLAEILGKLGADVKGER